MQALARHHARRCRGLVVVSRVALDVAIALGVATGVATGVAPAALSRAGGG